VSVPDLRPLHDAASLNRMKLAHFRKLETQILVDSLKPGQPGSLKAKLDGTLMDGHHRVSILAERGVDVHALPREILARDQPEQL
jgi:hypothetical protein